MTLDSIEEGARFCIEKYGADADKPSVRLSLAILAMLPVVRAAEAWSDSHQPWPHAEAKPLSPTEHPFRDERQLHDAIDTMRKATK